MIHVAGSCARCAQYVAWLYKEKDKRAQERASPREGERSNKEKVTGQVHSNEEMGVVTRRGRQEEYNAPLVDPVSTRCSNVKQRGETRVRRKDCEPLKRQRPRR